jgi:hypothetical protein
VYQVILLAILFFLLSVSGVQAEIVSIVNMDGSSREAILMEAALKRLLRANGYTVHGAGTEGYVVLLHGMSAQSKQGVNLGVVGSATVARVLRKESAAALRSESSLTHQEFIEKFTAVMGSPVIYLASTTAMGEDAEIVAEILNIYITTVVRRSSTKAQELLQVLDHRVQDHSITSPIR